jgi:magnesium chelatase family protein
VRAAIRNSGFRFPPENITINLAPADVRKEGPSFDLPIALGLLAVEGVFPADTLGRYVFLGELALDGSLRPIRGALVVADALRGDLPLVLPAQNAREIMAEKIETQVLGIHSLAEAASFLKGEKMPEPLDISTTDETVPGWSEPQDFSEIQGQAMARRAVEIACAGGHNLLMIGSPGSGKTMLASRIPSILSPLTDEERLDLRKIYSLSGHPPPAQKRRPFRSPHHSISAAAMSGGGTHPRPGEVSLAHSGVLFLDELPEFRREVLETLRTPLEEGRIVVSRARMSVGFPCRFMLAAAMNPCPCGHLSDPRKLCRCSLGHIHKYRSRVSGPLLDRIDLHLEVPPLSYGQLTAENEAESSESIRRRVLACRAIQAARFRSESFCLNSRMTMKHFRSTARPTEAGRMLLEKAMKELALSARGYYKILKIARTIADLEEAETVKEEHIAEAIQYRSLDRKWL